MYAEGVYLNEDEGAEGILLTEGEAVYLSEVKYQSIDCI